MPGPKPESQPRFSREERRRAEKIARTRSAPHQHVWRARLALELSREPGLSSPEAARRVLCANGKDLDLWPWVDPGRPVAGQEETPGIPAKTLARLVQRMEQL